MPSRRRAGHVRLPVGLPALVVVIAGCAGPADRQAEVSTSEPPAASTSVRVSAKATGAFGSLLGGIANEPDPTALHMVAAASLGAGERVTVTALAASISARATKRAPRG